MLVAVGVGLERGRRKWEEGHVLSLTRYPVAPMMRKPTPTAWQTLMNSFWSAVLLVSEGVILTIYPTVVFGPCLLRVKVGGGHRTERKLTLRAPVDELTTVLDELLGNVEDLVRHGWWWWCWCWWVMLIRYVGDYAMLLRNGGRREKSNVEGGKK